MKLLSEAVCVWRGLYQLKICPIIFRRNIKGRMLSRIGKLSSLNARKGGSIRSEVGLKIGSFASLSALNGGCIIIGKNVGIGDNCRIISHQNITIQDGTMVAPNVFIYDHDHDFHAGLREMKYKTDSVSIGANCWIGANVVILKGTQIGDNCVVGAGSVIRGSYPANSVIVQKRETTIIPYGREEK